MIFGHFWAILTFLLSWHISFSVINHCYDEPCKNNGSCVINGDSYLCTCPAVFTGPNCEGKHTRLCLHSLSELFTLHRNLSDTGWTISKIGVVQLLFVTEIAPKSPLFGGVSNDNGDGDGNENAKKAMGLLSKTRILHVHRICGFCTFLCRHCTTTTWKCLISRFMEDVTKRRRIFLSFSKLGCGSQEINSRKIRLHLTFSADGNKRDNVWKKANALSKLRFCYRRRRRRRL